MSSRSLGPQVKAKIEVLTAGRFPFLVLSEPRPCPRRRCLVWLYRAAFGHNDWPARDAGSVEIHSTRGVIEGFEHSLIASTEL